MSVATKLVPVANDVAGTPIDLQDGRISSSNPSAGDILQYNSTSGKYVNSAPPKEILYCSLIQNNGSVYMDDGTTVNDVDTALFSGKIVICRYLPDGQNATPVMLMGVNAVSPITLVGTCKNGNDVQTVVATGQVTNNTDTWTITTTTANPYVQSDWNASSGSAVILNKPTLAAVATSGSYNDLTNTPTIPTDSDLVHLAGSETITGKKTTTADFVLKSSTSSGATPSLILQRGTASDSYVDWKIVSDSNGLSVKRSSSGTDGTKILVTNTKVSFTNDVESSAFVVPNGTSSQFLKADGSVDSTAYQPALPAYTNNSGKVLAVNSGATDVEWVKPVKIYYDTAAPSNNIGSEGDIYVQII